MWGYSYAAWTSRFSIALILISLTYPVTARFARLRLIVALFFLVLTGASVLWPQPPGTPFHVSALSAITLVYFCAALVLLSAGLTSLYRFVPWLGLVGVTFNGVTLLGYIYGARPLYGGMGGTVGIFSAITSITLGIGVTFAGGTNFAPLRLVTGPSVSAKILRSILPVTFAAMLLGEITSDAVLGAWRGNVAVQDALQTFFATVFITGVVLMVGKRVGQRLDSAEEERDRARAALAETNNSLTMMVAEQTAQLREANRELHEEIARRAEIEQALRESEAKSAALLAALPDWILRLQADGTILDFRSPREFPDESREVQSLLTARVSEWVRCNPRIRARETVDFTFPDATYEARFVRSGPDQVLAVVRDISELSRLEREVLEANAREQRRIGEELHDGIGQQLTAVAFLSRILEMELAEKNIPQAAQAGEITRQTSASISMLRSLARGLFRYELGTGSLPDALEDLAHAADTNFRVRCTVDADRDILLPDRAADLHLYRISQEAITNAVKHGQAKAIHIELKRENAQIVFRVQDDGNGAPVVARSAGCGNGIGLRTMEFRTRRLGGRFAIESRPGRGTLITCTLPETLPCIANECPPREQLPLAL